MVEVMDKIYFEKKSFDKIDFGNELLKKGEYENCKFTNCSFYNSDLSDVIFVDCEFTSCDLSMAKVTGTTFNNAKFINCKILGVRFQECNDFGLSFDFDSCILNHSSFFKKKMKKTVFKNSQLVEADFTECDLTSAVFSSCELTRTVFQNTIIEKADLSTSYNFTIDPENNRIKKAKFSLDGAAGLLKKYDIEIVT